MPRSRFIPNNVVKDFATDVALGLVPGKKYMHALGYREGMGTTASGEEIWPGNDLAAAPTSHVLIPLPAGAGEQMTLDCENANDTIAGSGVQVVTIEYLDGSGDEQTTTVNTNGTTAVDLTPSDVSFINDMYASQVGSAQAVAAGHIFVHKKTDAGLVYNMIHAGGNKSMVPRRMVPNNKTLILQSWNATEAQNKRVNVRIRADSTPAGVRQAGVYLFKSLAYLNQTVFPASLTPYKFPEFTVITVAGWPDAIAADVSCDWYGILVDD